MDNSDTTKRKNALFVYFFVPMFSKTIVKLDKNDIVSNKISFRAVSSHSALIQNLFRQQCELFRNQSESKFQSV